MSNKIMAQQPYMSADDFLKTLDIFNTNYVKFKTFGDATYDQARGVAQTSIEKTLANMQANVDQNNQFIAAFNPPDQASLEKLHKESQMIQKKGPEIQDEYLSEKKRKEFPDQVDYKPYYIKVAIISALLAVAVLV
jgi:hypothetical protein